MIDRGEVRATLDAILGKWTCDPDAGSVAARADRIYQQGYYTYRELYSGFFYEFFADETFVFQPFTNRGNFILSADEVTLTPTTLWDVPVKSTHPTSMSFDEGRICLTWVSKGWSVVYVKVNSPRGESLWQEAKKGPSEISPGEVSAVILSYFREKLHDYSLDTLSSLGQGSLNLSDLQLTQHAIRLNKKMRATLGLRFKASYTVDFTCCKTLADLTENIYCHSVKIQ